MNQNILLVDDDPGAIQLLGRILSDSGTLRFATSGFDALRLAQESLPDLMLLDAEMPGMSGFHVLEALKADPALAGVPVIFVTSHDEPAFEVAAFELGAADFIAKPVSAELVLARVQTQLRGKVLADGMRRIAMVDMITGLANRRRFDEALDQEWRRARRSGDALALLMIDVDHFGPFNARYGGAAGDSCLRAVAKALSAASLRPADLVARHGNEVFAMLLPQTPRGGGETLALRVLEAVEALDIAHDESPTARHVTVSVGVSCYDSESACWVQPCTGSRFTNEIAPRCSPVDLVQAADMALFGAKQAGRAQARLLDIADADTPQMVRDIAPPPRRARIRSGVNA